MKAFKNIAAGIDGGTWLFLHMLGMFLLVVGLLCGLIVRGIEAAMLDINASKTALLARLEAK